MQVQLNVDIGGVGLSGEAFDHGVGHDLIPAPAVSSRDRGIGVLPQRGIAGDALLHGKVAGEQSHGVERWGEPDAAMVTFGAAPLHVAVPVSLIGGVLRTPAVAALNPSLLIPAASSCSSTAWRASRVEVSGFSHDGFGDLVHLTPRS